MNESSNVVDNNFSNEELQKELFLLRKKFKEAGYFQTSKVQIYFDILLHLILFPTAYYLSGHSLILSFAVSVFAEINLAWWLHDAGHDAFFESKKESQFWIELLSIAFFGMSQLDFHYSTHRKHHGQTNVIGKDPALDTGPIIWHESMLGKTSPFFLKMQGLVWLFVIIPFTHLFITFDSLKLAYLNKNYMKLTIIALRWFLLIHVFKIHLLILLSPVAVSSFVGLLSCLNHFHLPIFTKPKHSNFINIFHVTQNMTHTSYFLTWVFGGLNFHIEHHLFPNMPSRNYRKVAPAIEELAVKFNLPYNKCNLPTAFSNFVQKVFVPTTLGKEMYEK